MSTSGKKRAPSPSSDTEEVSDVEKLQTETRKRTERELISQSESLRERFIGTLQTVVDSSTEEVDRERARIFHSIETVQREAAAAIAPDAPWTWVMSALKKECSADGIIQWDKPLHKKLHAYLKTKSLTREDWSGGVEFLREPRWKTPKKDAASVSADKSAIHDQDFSDGEKEMLDSIISTYEEDELPKQS